LSENTIVLITGRQLTGVGLIHVEFKIMR